MEFNVVFISQGQLGLLAFVYLSCRLYDNSGGDMASTWVAKPRVHAEDSTPRKSY